MHQLWFTNHSASTINTDSAIENLTTFWPPTFSKISQVHPPDNNHTFPRVMLLEINFKSHIRSHWHRFRDTFFKTLSTQTTRVKDLMFDYRNSQWNNLFELLCNHNQGIRKFYKLYKFLLRKPQPDHLSKIKIIHNYIHNIYKSYFNIRGRHMGPVSSQI